VSEVQIDDLLPFVERPSRYLGREINSIHKDKDKVSLRAAIVFPDLYEVGMSHLGIHILYDIGNRLEGVQTERAFLPQDDLLDLLKGKSRPLFTLESRTPLHECDLVGFTLQSELTYTNILTVLDSGNIPLRAEGRTEEAPLVLGGGPCAFNPEPLAEFFDLFFIGDAEVQWPLILEALKIRVSGSSRRERIESLKEIEGIYDPRDFKFEYNDDNTVKSIKPVTSRPEVVKALCADLETQLLPTSLVVPFLQPVHDRITLEVARGCTRGCRFCHAGMVYRPARERSAQTIMEAARDSLRATGYADLSLTSLSIGDYTHLDEVLLDLMDTYCGDRISVSLPSMRVKGLTPEVARQIQRVKKTGFTIAPEAGTGRLRKVVNKDLSEDEIVGTARWVFGQGWDSLKLYFMIGLPTESDEDLEGIVNLVKKMAAVAPGRGRITVNISPFVPKSHTPFQWVSQESEPEMKRKLDYLRAELKRKKVQVKWGRTDQAMLEAVLARGDRRISEVIRTAWEMGARQDGWDEHFDWDIWATAFDKCGIDPGFYATRIRKSDELFCWDHISSGVTREFLLNEYKKGLAGEVTSDCREAGCFSCGVCPPGFSASIPPLRDVLAVGDDVQEKALPAEAERSVRRIRAIFEKTGYMRYIGHLEMMRAFERAARRASVPLAFTGGFSPKAKINFALSMPLGVAGLAEWADIELLESWPAERLMFEINNYLPEGLKILKAWKAPLEGQSLNVRVRAIEYLAVLPERDNDLAKRIRRIMDSESIKILRKKGDKTRTIELRDYLRQMWSDNGKSVFFVLSITDKGSARPLEVIEALLEEPVAPGNVLNLTRTRLFFNTMEDKSGGRPGLSRIFD